MPLGLELMTTAASRDADQARSTADGVKIRNWIAEKGERSELSGIVEIVGVVD